MYSERRNIISFQVNCMTNFSGNNATSGGALMSTQDLYIVFADSSSVIFARNVGITEAGAILCLVNGNMAVEANSVIAFFNNTTRLGSAVVCIRNIVRLFQGKEVVFSLIPMQLSLLELYIPTILM